MNETKFDSKGGVYSKGRPGYPDAMMQYFLAKGIAGKEKTVADIGSGTGIFTMQISAFANLVYAVEPNHDMRAVAEEKFKAYSNIVSLNASAEKTGISAASVDLITVAQAFHWFDRAVFKNECQRIMKPEGKIVLIWNDRDASTDIVKENFAVNKTYCPNFKGSSNGMDFSKEGFNDFFEGEFDLVEFENDMLYGRDEFIDRNLSSSYAPLKHEKHYNDYIKSLETVFHKYQKNGIVAYPYITRCYMGNVFI